MICLDFIVIFTGVFDQFLGGSWRKLIKIDNNISIRNVILKTIKFSLPNEVGKHKLKKVEGNGCFISKKKTKISKINYIIRIVLSMSGAV